MAKKKSEAAKLINVLENNCRTITGAVERMENLFGWSEGKFPKSYDVVPIRDDLRREQALAIVEETLRQLYQFRCRIRKDTHYPHKLTLDERMALQEMVEEERDAKEQRKAALRKFHPELYAD